MPARLKLKAFVLAPKTLEGFASVAQQQLEERESSWAIIDLAMITHISYPDFNELSTVRLLFEKAGGLALFYNVHPEVLERVRGFEKREGEMRVAGTREEVVAEMRAAIRSFLVAA